MSEENKELTAQLGDWLLATLISVANSMDTSFDIVAMINGLMITGTVITGKEYFRQFGDTIAGAFERGNQEKDANFDSIRAMFNGLADELYSPAKQTESPEVREGTKDDRSSSIGYVHLRNVKIIQPHELAINSEFPYWRCRIEVIDAWTLGRPR